MKNGKCLLKIIFGLALFAGDMEARMTLPWWMSQLGLRQVYMWTLRLGVEGPIHHANCLLGVSCHRSSK